MNRLTYCMLALFVWSALRPAAAEDLTTWREIPVFHDGRVMPLDSFANSAVELICKTSKGKLVSRYRIELGLLGYYNEKELDKLELAAALELFPEGQPRTWSSSELLLSWLAESEKWERVPFIEAGHEELRRLIGLRSFDSEEDVIATYQGKDYRLLWVGEVQPPPEPGQAAAKPAASGKEEPLPKIARLQSLDGTEELAVDVKEIKLKAGSVLPEGTPSITGHRLKYVSPERIAKSKALAQYYRAISGGMRPGEPPLDIPGIKRSEALDNEVRELITHYALYRRVTFDPRTAVTISPIAREGDRTRFVQQLTRAYQVVAPRNEDGSDAEGQALLPKLLELRRFQHLPEDARTPIAQLFDSLEKLVGIYQVLVAVERGDDREGTFGKGDEIYRMTRDGIPLASMDRIVQDARHAARDLAEALERERESVFKLIGQSDDPAIKKLAPLIREVSYKCRELASIGLEMHLALYDTEDSLMVVPALNAPALSSKRDAKSRAHPWLSLTAVLYGSDGLLDFSTGERGYPQDEVTRVRETYQTLASVYRDRKNEFRDVRLTTAQDDFAQALRELADKVEPRRLALVRRELDPKEQDADLLKYTNYPQPGQTVREVNYNSLDPFKWSWMLSLVALCCYAIAALPGFRSRMVWVGFSIQAASILWTIYAFYLRVTISGWAPVTNMFETVVFVPFVAAVLGAWFLILPMIWRGIEAGWRLSAAPFTPEETPLTDHQTSLMNAGLWRTIGSLEQAARLGMMVFMLLFLAVWKYGDGARPLFHLLPDLEGQASMGGILNKLVVWVVGLVVMGLALWLVPRVVLTFVNSLVFVPWSWAHFRDEVPQWQSETTNRWLFGFAGTAVAAASTWLAWYAPANILNENFSPLQPVLRSNFWLTIHVLTIVASYGAGMLALLLGNVALFFYLVGPYRYPEIAANPAPGFGPAKRPPGPAAENGSESFPWPLFLLLFGFPAILWFFMWFVSSPPSQPRGENDLRQPMRAPEICGTLADYCYRVIQVAIVLLATGTILGGLWADVSWGRFWGWDPKEVWALITLLVYLAILHGRFAGWFNDFGMVAGTVAGAVAIMLSWYGVNFLLPLFSGGKAVGLHGYGFGAGGQEWVISFMVANVVYGIAAGCRYFMESNHLVEPHQVETTMPAIEAEVASPEEEVPHTRSRPVTRR